MTCRGCSHYQKGKSGRAICTHESMMQSSWRGALLFPFVDDPIVGERCGIERRLYTPNSPMRALMWIVRLFVKDKP